MAAYATTKLSSRGQVVIPEEIRNTLGLNEGELLSQARAEAKRAGVKKADLKTAIARIRRRAK